MRMPQSLGIFITFFLQVDLLHLLRTASLSECLICDTSLLFASYHSLPLSFVLELLLANIYRNHPLKGQRWS